MNIHWKKGVVAAALSLVILAQSAAAAHAEAKYKAKDDDTFWKISSQFGVSVDLLQQANPFVDAANIYEGLMLVIPATATAKSTTPVKATKLAADKQAVKPAAKKTAEAPKAAAKKVAPAKKAAPAKKVAPAKKAAPKKAATTSKARKTTAQKPQADRVTVNGKSYVYTDVVQAKASAYTAAASENGWGAVDYFGNPLKLGTIAVDPDVIPMGSKLYITGYDHNGLPSGGMMAVASDQGSAISGNRIDIFVPQSQQQASNFGFQSVKVFVLDK
ncbi:3D domain-containing protein [Paenibacillus glycinis]|uniref:LysM peptidoglycan-binding domain-containing protein n=1 Tax=Paenibacillus glycinis TaxID=2697035 RepID=A0ABW9XU93_9BACL|nr:3D domain-containing protein [Paenibacillus glycinis]NBD26243.1 LysM peptidoglycan-binding domain-containing protein [Paenibacillus glycinis]